MTSRRILSAISGGVVAARVGPVDPAVHVVVGIGGPPEAEPIGHAAGRSAAPAAAFGNGMLIGTTRPDPEHAGAGAAMAVVLPVASVVGREVKARGDEVLITLIAGHEPACRPRRMAHARSGCSAARWRRPG